MVHHLSIERLVYGNFYEELVGSNGLRFTESAIPSTFDHHTAFGDLAGERRKWRDRLHRVSFKDQGTITRSDPEHLTAGQESRVLTKLFGKILHFANGKLVPKKRRNAINPRA